jgi:hypothetical protein
LELRVGDGRSDNVEKRSSSNIARRERLAVHFSIANRDVDRNRVRKGRVKELDRSGNAGDESCGGIVAARVIANVDDHFRALLCLVCQLRAGVIFIEDR